MELQVVEHRLGEGGGTTLPPAPRVVYRLDENVAEFSTGAVELTGQVHALAFELVQAPPDGPLLSAALTPQDDEERLIRCDRVDFPPGGVAYLHTHQGPGIRVLLHGTIRIDTAGQSRSYGPLEAWFEPGPEPVFAAASETEPTAFVRCMILPARLRGQSSIRYVRDEDAAKPKSQRYTVFVDEPLGQSTGAR
jgi:quercetin dioxygenase-like cupin family protein